MTILSFDQIPILASLTVENRLELKKAMQRLTLQPGETLFREGERGDTFFIVLEGEIDIIKALGTETERLLRSEGPGEFFGELSLLDPAGKRTATVRARTKVLLAALAQEEFEALLLRRPLLAYEMLQVLSQRLRQSDNATIRELRAKNQELREAYEALQAAQAQIIEKRALEKELQVGREIQQSILPNRLPQVPGYEFGGVMRPARHVAGDFYDVIPLDDGRIGVAIGDVAGKGVPAALYMALSASILRAEATVGRSPSQTLRRMNRLLQEMSSAPMFVTIVYGILDPAERTFSYARAGHEIPVLFEGSTELKCPQHDVGQILGILDAPKLDVQTLSLAPGDLLVLYTDGVSEAADVDDVFFGVDGIRNAVVAHASTPCQLLCQRIVEAVVEYHGSTLQDDDITLVAIRALLSPGKSGN